MLAVLEDAALWLSERRPKPTARAGGASLFDRKADGRFAFETICQDQRSPMLFPRRHGGTALRPRRTGNAIRDSPAREWTHSNPANNA